jgi:pyruvate kinase
MNSVKIVATIGPISANEDMLRQLVAAGMNVARLNGSHADLDWHAATIELIRRIAPELPILLDIPGRKIRTQALLHEPSFAAGDTVILTTDGTADGRERIPVNREDLHESVRVGGVIFADDGTLRFTILEIRGRDIVCRAENAGTLRSAKGINVPGAVFDSQGLTMRDKTMLDFAKGQHVDLVGISFVESEGHVDDVRRTLGAEGPQVLAKVENLGAMSNLEEVIAAADAVMIDRGDLSVETDLEGVALRQKQILRVAQAAGTPVIVATEMLHSMMDHAVPTKAEVSDITNAVLDGASALMLSGETAVGRYPVEAVSVMRRVADRAAESVQDSLDATTGASVPMAVGEAIALMCRRLPITKIVAITISGYAARMVAAGRPRQPILAVSNNEGCVRSLNLLYGTEAVFLPVKFSRTSTDHVAACLKALWLDGRLVEDDLVLVTSVGYPKHGTRMNLIQTHSIRDLLDTLGWERS